MVNFIKQIFCTIIKISLWSINQQNCHNTFSNTFTATTNLISIYLSEICLTLKIAFTHVPANKFQHHPFLSFPTQNILYLEFFPPTNLADAPLHLSSYQLQMSTLLLLITSTTSFDWSLIFPTFYKHTLKFWYGNLLMIWQC